jgi:hypothetical protein
MKIWQIVVPGLLGLILAGCQTDPSIALLERDNFKKEQEINRLTYENQELKEALEAVAPAERTARPRELLPEPGAADRSRTAPPATRPGASVAPPARSYAEPDAPAAGGFHVSPGTEVPSGEVPDRMRVPGESAPRAVSPGGSQWTPPDNRPVGGLALPDNNSVAQITLHPALTGGIGTGSRPGDEGLMVVVEPRDFGGNIVNVPGDISVALLDPALAGDEARLARWDFVAAETQGMIRTGSQPGIHLRLPWNSAPPHDRLKVFVRYTTRDGRKLQAERLISVALGGPPPERDVMLDSRAAETASRPQRPEWSPLR